MRPWLTFALFLFVFCFSRVTIAAQSMSGVFPDEPREVFLKMMAVTDKKTLAKDEFETEDQYLDRLAKFAGETPIKTAPGRTLKDTVFFLNAGDDVAKYDAEAHEFRFDAVKLFLRSMPPTGTKEYTFELVRRSYGEWAPDLMLGMRIPSVRMLPDQARLAKPSLTIAFYGLPVGYDWNSTRSTVSLWARRVVVFNMTTGEIYSDQAIK